MLCGEHWKHLGVNTSNLLDNFQCTKWMKSNCASSLLNRGSILPSTMQRIGSLSYVLCDSTGHPWSPCFHGENRSFPKSFWQNSPLLWLVLRNNSWLYSKYCGGHSTQCNNTESNNTSIYLKNWCSRMLEHNSFSCVRMCFYVCTCTGTKI